MRRRYLIAWCVPLALLGLVDCGDSEGYYPLPEAAGMGNRGPGDFSGGTGACGGVECAPGFHCEFDSCVADAPPPPPPSAEVRDPLSSRRYVFALEIGTRRLVRIDSLTLEVAAFPAGLAPMDLAVIGSRELSVLLDGLDVIEVLDH
ncbi:MAG: hypothetical protein V3T05_11280, partial [Myxococcota bacterium]